jgi:hypothetical protein
VQDKPNSAEIPDDGRFVAKSYQPNEPLGEVIDLMRKAG